MLLRESKLVSKNPPEKRNYRREAAYEDTPQQVRHREERNAARRQFEAGGKKLPHGVDIAHIKPLAGGGANTRSNERVEAVAKNRSWRKGQKGYKVPIDSGE